MTEEMFEHGNSIKGGFTEGARMHTDDEKIDT
jgi:hypothetical protein